jgi:hypothetical protein
MRERIVEPTYDTAGGPDYIAVRNAMEQSQDRYISFWRTDARSADTNVARTEMERLQAGYFAIRQRHTPQVAQAQKEALRRYWSETTSRGLRDDFFADCPADSIPALMSRIEPAWWWREFFLCLQHRCQRFHAADGVFLDHLPTIRARVSVKKLSAEVAEWSKGMSDRWGWDGPGHYRMLADRAAAKARALHEWYETCAPHSTLGWPACSSPATRGNRSFPGGRSKANIGAIECARRRLRQLRLLWQVGGMGSPSFNNCPARSSARAARVASRRHPALVSARSK